MDGIQGIGDASNYLLPGNQMVAIVTTLHCPFAEGVSNGMGCANTAGVRMVKFDPRNVVEHFRTVPSQNNRICGVLSLGMVLEGFLGRRFWKAVLQGFCGRVFNHC